MSERDILAPVSAYYTAKLATHGLTPQGVDWNGEAGQTLRFDQLARVLPADAGLSVNDLGCGYGAMFEFLRERHPGVRYSGFDVSEAMVLAARERAGDRAQARFAVAAAPDEIADFGFASGIFNVRLGHPDDAWRAHVVTCLDALERTSARGFAFNCLTSYSDAPRMRADLWYADPCEWFDFCKRRYARNVALLHDYGLYEFTILVRKDP